MRLKEEFFRRASPPPSGECEVPHPQPEEWEKENIESTQKGGGGYKLPQGLPKARESGIREQDEGV